MGEEYKPSMYHIDTVGARSENDEFNPIGADGRPMGQEEAINMLHTEANKEHVRRAGRERLDRVVKTCGGIWGGIKANLGKGCTYLGKLGIAAAESGLGIDKAAVNGKRKIKNGLAVRAESAKNSLNAAGESASKVGREVWHGAYEGVKGVWQRGRETVNGIVAKINDNRIRNLAESKLRDAGIRELEGHEQYDIAIATKRRAENHYKAADALREEAYKLVPALRDRDSQQEPAESEASQVA